MREREGDIYLDEHWTSVSTALSVTKEVIDPCFIHDTLKMEESSAGHFCHIDSGPDWWTCTYDGSAAPVLDEQIALLVGHVRPRLAQIAVLLRVGHQVQVTIEGTVETGSDLFVSPVSMELLTSLHIPVSFTTLTSTGMPAEDFLSWLDD